MVPERGVLVFPMEEVPVVKAEMVTATLDLTTLGVGPKSIAPELAIARNTVRRLQRVGLAEVRVRPSACRLSR